jgi:hypothetical protein
MRTTVTLDDDLLAKATKMMGGLDRSTVLREGLKALIERESAIRLAKLAALNRSFKQFREGVLPQQKACGVFFAAPASRSIRRFSASGSLRLVAAIDRIL